MSLTAHLGAPSPSQLATYNDPFLALAATVSLLFHGVYHRRFSLPSRYFERMFGSQYPGTATADAAAATDAEAGPAEPSAEPVADVQPAAAGGTAAAAAVPAQAVAFVAALQALFPAVGSGPSAPKEMACRWIRQGCIVSCDWITLAWSCAR